MGRKREIKVTIRMSKKEREDLRFVCENTNTDITNLLINLVKEKRQELEMENLLEEEEEEYEEEEDHYYEIFDDGGVIDEYDYENDCIWKG